MTCFSVTSSQFVSSQLSGDQISVFSSVGVLRMSLGKLPRADLCVVFGTKYRHRIFVCVENGVKENVSLS